jgi:hypothetical protein
MIDSILILNNESNYNCISSEDISVIVENFLRNLGICFFSTVAGAPRLKTGGSKSKEGPNISLWQNKRKTGDFSAILDVKKRKTWFKVTLNYKKIFIKPENKRYSF